MSCIFTLYHVHVFNTLQPGIISLIDVSDILHIFMNKLYTFHVTVHDLEGQSSEGLECFII